MPEYILSSHPVWVLLYGWGLPHEIINIIFKYNTYLTPLKFTFPEYKTTTMESNYRLEEGGDRGEYIETLILFRNILFKNKNKSNIKLIGMFIKLNYRLYSVSNDKLFNLFLEYHNDTYVNAVNVEAKMKLKLKKNITVLPKTNSNLIMCSNLLKHCCLIKFQDTITSIKRANTLSSYPQYFSPTFCSIWKWANEMKYIWKLITFIVTTNNRNGRFSKPELQLYNFMMGYPFYKSWSRDRLVQNLIQNEPYDNSNLYYVLNKNKHLDISILIEIFSRVSISTSNYVGGSRIDYPTTLKHIIPAYNNYLLDQTVTIWDDKTHSFIVPIITLEL